MRQGKNASDLYQHITDEVDGFHSAIQRLHTTFAADAAIQSGLDRAQCQALHVLLKTIGADIEIWETTVEKHCAVRRRSRWGVTKFATTDISPIRLGISQHTRSLVLFLSTYNTARLEHIETRLSTILDEVEKGNRDFQAYVAEDANDAVTLVEDQWDDLQDELLADGFVRGDIAAHRSWFQTRLPYSRPANNQSVSAWGTSNRGRSLSRSSSHRPQRQGSRATSVHSEVSEYDADGRLTKHKTITTTYSNAELPWQTSSAPVTPAGHAPVNVSRRSSVGPRSRRGSFAGLARVGLEERPASRPAVDWKSLFEAREAQLQLLVSRMTEVGLVDYTKDPLRYGPSEHKLHNEKAIQGLIERSLQNTSGAKAHLSHREASLDTRERSASSPYWQPPSSTAFVPSWLPLLNPAMISMSDIHSPTDRSMTGTSVSSAGEESDAPITSPTLDTPSKQSNRKVFNKCYDIAMPMVDKQLLGGVPTAALRPEHQQDLHVAGSSSVQMPEMLSSMLDVNDVVVSSRPEDFSVDQERPSLEASARLPAHLNAPFLSLDSAKMHQIDPGNMESLLDMWTVLSKCSHNIKDGKRLENMSWRLWSREALCHPPKPARSFAPDIDALVGHSGEVPSLSNSLASGPKFAGTIAQDSPSSNQERVSIHNTQSQAKLSNGPGEPKSTETFSHETSAAALPDEFMEALYDYASNDPSRLNFKQGTIIHVLTRLDSGWNDGIVNGIRGWFPRTYCKEVGFFEPGRWYSEGDLARARQIRRPSSPEPYELQPPTAREESEADLREILLENYEMTDYTQQRSKIGALL